MQIEYIIELPVTQLPEVFGVHMNPDIIKNQRNSHVLFKTVSKYGIVTGNNSSDTHHDITTRDARLSQISQGILSRLPQQRYNIDWLQLKFPIDHKACLNIFLVQECMRNNTLLACVRKSLEKLVMMSEKGLRAWFK